MSAAPEAQPMLEDVLLALQKTFSRLSASTGMRVTDEHKDKALAMIVGDVDFEIKLNVEPVGTAQPDAAEDKRRKPARAKARAGDAVSASRTDAVPSESSPTFDRLRCRADGGGMALTLRGRVATDLRIKAAPSDEAGQGAAT